MLVARVFVLMVSGEFRWQHSSHTSLMYRRALTSPTTWPMPANFKPQQASSLKRGYEFKNEIKPLALAALRMPSMLLGLCARPTQAVSRQLGSATLSQPVPGHIRFLVSIALTLNWF